MKIVIVLVVVALLILGGWIYTTQNSSNDTATTTPEVATTTDTTTVGTPIMEDGAGGPEAARGAYVDGTYTLDVSASSIGWVGGKTLIKNYKDSGTLSFASGSVVVTNGTISGGTFTIDMNSFNVTSTGKGDGNDMLEGHLKSEDFFAVEAYPTATVKVNNIVNGVVSADVTIKGVTKTISFPATITQNGAELSGTASMTIDRTLWNIQYGSTKFFGDLGDKVIDDKVMLTLNLKATK